MHEGSRAGGSRHGAPGTGAVPCGGSGGRGERQRGAGVGAQPRTARASISMSRPGGQADVDRRTGGGGLREALLLEVGVVDLVHLGEVVDVGEVDADHHHVVPARAALLQDRP